MEYNPIFNEVYIVRSKNILLIKLLVLFLARNISFNLELLCLYLRQICLEHNRSLFIKYFQRVLTQWRS